MYKNVLDEFFDVKMYHFWSNKYISEYTYNKKKYVVKITFEYICNVIKRLWQLYTIAPRCDIVFIQKGVIPGFKCSFINHLNKKRKWIVFDVDDAIYLGGKDISDQIAVQSSVVICGNEELESHYKKYNSNCVILPTIENTRKFRPYWSDTFDKKIIGWIGSGATLRNLDLVVDAINIFSERHPEVKFHIICNTAGEYIKRIRCAKFIKWQLDTYISEMGKFTVGIMPLKDIPINHGKCGFKLVQCLNMMKPVIATDMGVNKIIVGKCGLLAETTENWVEALERLIYDREFYDCCVESITEEFLPGYDFDVIANKLIAILDQ